jgi:MOSC domain-containing protein YiiM
MRKGILEAIYVSAIKGGPMQSVAQVHAVPGRGLEGDRYFLAPGVSPKDNKVDRQITLIEVEAVDALCQDQRITVSPADIRRNLVLRGAQLNQLVDKKFKVGEVALRGMRLCEPCQYLAKITQPEVLPGLLHRGGLRAEILSEGMMRVGDAVDFIQEEDQE